MRLLHFWLSALGAIVFVLTACSVQPDFDLVSQFAEADSTAAAPPEGVTPADTLSGQTESSVLQDEGPDGEPESNPGVASAAWVGLPGRDDLPKESVFLAAVENLGSAAALQTTITRSITSYGTAVSYDEVRQTNTGEDSARLTSTSRGAKILADGIVWSEDRDTPNLYVGVEYDDPDDEYLSNDYVLDELRDAIIEIAGFSEHADGSQTWYLLIDTAAVVLTDLFGSDYDATGTVFDTAVMVAQVDASGTLASAEVDLAASDYVRSRLDRSWTNQTAIRTTFETFDTPFVIEQPCAVPTTASDDRLRQVLHCPIDDAGFVAPHVSIGYLEDPAATAHVYVLAHLMRTLGYQIELVPLNEGADIAYEKLASNTIDLYASGWFPSDDGQLARVLSNGSTVGDAVERFDEPFAQAARVSGLIATTEWLDGSAITSIDQINADPALYGEIDFDGNGKGEIEGCAPTQSCRPWLEHQIATVWTNLELTERSYQEAADDLFLLRILDEPALAVVTLPDARFNNYFDEFATVSIPGGVVPNTEEFGTACRTVAEPCAPGFAVGDLEVVASSEWLAANPVGSELIEKSTIDAGWMHAIANEVLRESTRISGDPEIDTYAADRAGKDWVSWHEPLVTEWVDSALAIDPNFGVAPVQIPEAAPDSQQPALERSARNEGDLVAWEHAVLDAVQESGALESSDSTELLSLGAAAVCDGAVDAEVVMQLFTAAQDQFLDLAAQTAPFVELITTSCELKPHNDFIRSFPSPSDAVLPAGVTTWDDFITHVQQSGTGWGSFEDVEAMAARSCLRSGRLADYANGYSIGNGMLSSTQMQGLASLLEPGCDLLPETQVRALALFYSGRDELTRVFGNEAVDLVTDAEYECMVGQAAIRGQAPSFIDPIATFAPICSPSMVIEADTVRYTSAVVAAADARCAAEGLVDLAASSGDAGLYFGRWGSAVYPNQKALVDQVLRDDCGLSDAQIEDLGF